MYKRIRWISSLIIIVLLVTISGFAVDDQKSSGLELIQESHAAFGTFLSDVSVPTANASTSQIIGDLNGDGYVTAYDAVLLLQYVVGQETGFQIGVPYVANEPGGTTDVNVDTVSLNEAVNVLSFLKVVTENTATFAPNNFITREQMALFLYRYMNHGATVTGGTNTTTFTDLDPSYYAMISWISSHGIIDSASTTAFNPKGNLTLQEAYKYILRAIGYETDGQLNYPADYIALATQLNLNKNIPTDFSNTANVSKGIVTIMLYNALFSETADGTKTIAENLFGIVKDVQRVVSTPHYYLNDSLANTNFDTDVLLFNGSASFRPFNEFKLSGSADDYFLSDFAFYVATNESNQKIILSAKPLLQKTTVTKVTVGKVTPISASDYYSPDTKVYAKASGLLYIGGVKAYLFDAPYSYSKPEITPEISSNYARYYDALNRKDVQFIGLAPETNTTVSHFVTSQYSTSQGYDIFGLPSQSLYGSYLDGNTSVNVYSYTTDIFTNALNQVYSEGYYEMDTYDCDGDGIIDYIWYKPYTFGQVVNDQDYPTIDSHGIDSNTPYTAAQSGQMIPTIYINGAKMTGTAFQDKDFVLAYLNGPANYIKIASVVPPVTDALKSYNSSNFSITLENGTVFTTYGTNRLLAGFQGSADPEYGSTGAAFSARASFYDLYNADCLGTEHVFYPFNGSLLYVNNVATAGFNPSNPFLIPQTEETIWGYTTENGNIVKKPALGVYTDGDINQEVFVPVAVENNDVATEYNNYNQTYDFSAYASKICTFTVNAAGVYTLHLAINWENSSSEAAASMTSTDPNAQFGINTTNLVLKNVIGTTYELVDPQTDSNAYVLPNNALYLNFKDNTKMIIKSRSEATGEWIYTEFNATKLPYLTNTLSKIQLILDNNTSSTRMENIAALYAEVDGVLVQGARASINTDNRIVKNAKLNVDTAGVSHYYYSVYNPFTGKTEENIPGAKSAATKALLTTSAVTGQFYPVIDGVLQDCGSDSLNGATLFTASGTINRTALSQLLGYEDGVLEFKDNATIYKTDSATKVVVIEAGGTSRNNFKWGAVTTKSVSDLATNPTSLRSYCETTNASTGATEYLYSDHLEAFFTIDRTKSVAGQYDNVNLIVILRQKASDVSQLNYTDTKPEFQTAEVPVYTDTVVPNDDGSTTQSYQFNLNDPILIPRSYATYNSYVIENGYSVKKNTLSAYIGGTVNKIVELPVTTANNTPATMFNGIDSYDFGQYQNKICTYIVGTNGNSTIHLADASVLGTQTAALALSGSNADALYLAETSNVHLKNVGDANYSFTDEAGMDANVLPETVKTFTVTANTKIVILSMSPDTGEPVYTQYDLSNLPQINSKLDSVQYILVNNPTSTTNEFLGVLYAKVNGVLDPQIPEENPTRTPVKYTVGSDVVIPQNSETALVSVASGGFITNIPALDAYKQGNSQTTSAILPVETKMNTPTTLYDTMSGSYDFSDYANKICTFSINTIGKYALSLAIDDSNSSAAAAAEMAKTDAQAQYGISTQNVQLKQITGTTYEFINPTTSVDAGILPNSGLYVSIKDYTKIIIKSRSESTGEWIFTEYSINKLPNIYNSFSDIQMILVNNPTSTRTEFLSILYATIDGVIDDVPEVAGADSTRIVKTNGTIDIDASGLYHYYYDVYDPYTGTIQSNIQGVKGSTNATNLSGAATIGKFYELVNGVLQDNVSTSSLDGRPIFPSSGTFMRTYSQPTPSSLVQLASYTGDVLEIKGDETIYKTDADTKVILIEAGGTNKNDFKWGTVTAKTLSDLGSDSVSLRNYCNTTNPDTGRITTLYADNIEAFVQVDSTKEVAGQYEVIDFIVIMREKVSVVDFLNSNN